MQTDFKKRKEARLKATILLLLIWTSLGNASEYDVVEHTKATATDAFDNTGLWILGAGTVATLISFNYDNQVHDAWKDHQQLSAQASHIGDLWGTGVPEALIFAGQTYFDPDNGIPAFEGFILGGIVTHTTKFVIGRKRPDSNTRTAIPSGHTQAAFSIAASMTESYGWKVALPFWCMGVFTGMTRLADNAHWLSDVVAGATVGTFFGRAGYKHHQQIQPTVLFDNGKFDGMALAMKMEW